MVTVVLKADGTESRFENAKQKLDDENCSVSIFDEATEKILAHFEDGEWASVTQIEAS